MFFSFENRMRIRIDINIMSILILYTKAITKMSADKIPNAKVLMTVLQGEIKSYFMIVLQVNENISVDLNMMSKYRLNLHS
ncbi:hypothetical protein CN931_09085 [Bacillus sp. AFS054943]|uniref:Uncharacterized protein n=1 Tax=Bacillus cereus TaxID=1396 RepID=A0A2C1LQQ6_BACCE|nr:hypothetical protein CN476_11570 [Bacillus cereus]PFA56708.1 hypothetical protein CN402_23850 [Bacillus sp. AFS015896]PGL85352.1 hypothetical protein CN931_09085 [Bacillus sp. AFS054943]PGU00272.1 hypothetical protein COD19_16625 [Bacillus cereus]